MIVNDDDIFFLVSKWCFRGYLMVKYLLVIMSKMWYIVVVEVKVWVINIE